MKGVSTLNLADLRSQPVWRYRNSDERGETLVAPVKELPVGSLNGCLVASEIQLSCGRKQWSLVGNIDSTNPVLTAHFVTFSIFNDQGERFELARYHDFDFLERGPAKLAAFLGLKLNEVFPIIWDVRPYATGVDAALHGTVTEEPNLRLSRAQIIALAVP